MAYNASESELACELLGGTTLYWSDDENLDIGSPIYTHHDLETFALDGFYSDGTDWYEHVGGEIISIGTCD